ncbi:MAG TPA: organomercurial lyase [Gaiellaceae bacterium]|nr:organomercurial lyase [Gaiellaceae bacterium]
MDELDLRIRNHLYSSFVRDGVAQASGQAAAELALGEDEAAAAYRRLHDAHAIVLEPGSTTIRMLNPFSAVETSHRVEAAGRSWFANCAWDALGIPGSLHTDGRVESACPDCGEAVELEVRDGALVRGADLLVHFVVPARRWWDDIGFT